MNRKQNSYIALSLAGLSQLFPLVGIKKKSKLVPRLPQSFLAYIEKIMEPEDEATDNYTTALMIVLCLGLHVGRVEFISGAVKNIITISENS